MRIKHICVLVHIRTKDGVGTVKDVLALKWCFADRFKVVLLLWVFFCYLSFICILSVPCSHPITCWEMVDVLALSLSHSCCVFF